MARTIADLPSGSRITDYVSLGVIAKTFPLAKTLAILKATQKSSVRQRDLPAHVVVYYVIALADRKSTRLNSSHLGMSCAVFCLEKNSCRSGRLRCAASFGVGLGGADPCSRA